MNEQNIQTISDQLKLLTKKVDEIILTIERLNYSFLSDNIPNENWKVFHNIEVSDFGRVKTKHKGINYGGTNSAGYKQVDVRIGDKIIKYKVHRLVAHLFLNAELHATSTNNHINHINGDKLDNRVINLEIVTSRQNQQRRPIHLSGKLVGANFIKKTNKWNSSIMVEGKSINLGYYNTEYEAHQAYVKHLNSLGLQL